MIFAASKLNSISREMQMFLLDLVSTCVHVCVCVCVCVCVIECTTKTRGLQEAVVRDRWERSSF